MGSSISKAFKKVASTALGTIGLGSSTPAPAAAAEASTPAVAAETPVTQDQTSVSDADTLGEQKRTKRVGKQSLQVSRNSGGGLSV